MTPSCHVRVMMSHVYARIHNNIARTYVRPFRSAHNRVGIYNFIKYARNTRKQLSTQFITLTLPTIQQRTRTITYIIREIFFKKKHSDENLEILKTFL